MASAGEGGAAEAGCAGPVAAEAFISRRERSGNRGISRARSGTGGAGDGVCLCVCMFAPGHGPEDRSGSACDLEETHPIFPFSGRSPGSVVGDLSCFQLVPVPGAEPKEGLGSGACLAG